MSRSLGKRRRGAGTSYSRTPDFDLLESGAGTCGLLACSFTAECHALTRALQAVLTRRDTCPLVVLADSESCLSARQLGPCARVTAEVQQIWNYLLQLAGFRVVVLAFVYSHCDFVVHDAVDKLAGWASSYDTAPPPMEDRRPSFTPLLELRRWFPAPKVEDVQDIPVFTDGEIGELRAGVVHPYEERPPLSGWKDSARPFITPLRRRFCEAEQPTWRRGVAPPLDKPVSLPPWYVAKLLHRLRVGIDPDLGGWEAGAVPCSPCPWCGVGVDRQSATVHFLSCDALRSERVELGFNAEAIPLAELWDTDDRIRKVLQYRQRAIQRLRLRMSVG